MMRVLTAYSERKPLRPAFRRIRSRDWRGQASSPSTCKRSSRGRSLAASSRFTPRTTRAPAARLIAPSRLFAATMPFRCTACACRSALRNPWTRRISRASGPSFSATSPRSSLNMSPRRRARPSILTTCCRSPKPRRRCAMSAITSMKCRTHSVPHGMRPSARRQQRVCFRGQSGILRNRLPCALPALPRRHLAIARSGVWP
jgi:hypothetical protein